MTKTALRRSAVGIGAVVLVMGAYGAWKLGARRDKSVDPPRSELAFEPNAEQRRKLDELRARLSKDNPRFAVEDVRQKSNAKLFTYLAATSDEPLVVKASLEAIQSSYSSRSSRKEAPDSDLDRVLLKHLRSSEPAIARAAFKATRIPLMSEAPRSELVGALVEMARASNAAPRRHAAIEALDLIRPNARSFEVLSTFEQALTAPEAHIVSAALFALAQSGPSFAADPARRPAALGERVMALTAHSDPGVRGRALAALAELDWLASRELRLAKISALLNDAHPYVRAQAAAVIGGLGELSAIHQLIEKVGDLAPARYDLSGFVTLEGDQGTLPHVVPGRKRVADAVLHALTVLSAPTTPQAQHELEPFQSSLGAPGASDEAVQRDAELARAWYQKTRERIPGSLPPGVP